MANLESIPSRDLMNELYSRGHVKLISAKTKRDLAAHLIRVLLEESEITIHQTDSHVEAIVISNPRNLHPNE
jgi:hypothetical protein